MFITQIVAFVLHTQSLLFRRVKNALFGRAQALQVMNLKKGATLDAKSTFTRCFSEMAGERFFSFVGFSAISVPCVFFFSCPRLSRIPPPSLPSSWPAVPELNPGRGEMRHWMLNRHLLFMILRSASTSHIWSCPVPPRLLSHSLPFRHFRGWKSSRAKGADRCFSSRRETSRVHPSSSIISPVFSPSFSKVEGYGVRRKRGRDGGRGREWGEDGGNEW